MTSAAEVAAVCGRGDANLQVHALVAAQERQISVGRARGDQLDGLAAFQRPERAQHVAADGLEVLPRVLVEPLPVIAQRGELILVSVDDHMVEPPDMYKNHVPAKWADDVPKVVRNERGVDEWEFQGQKTATPFGIWNVTDPVTVSPWAARIMPWSKLVCPAMPLKSAE